MHLTLLELGVFIHELFSPKQLDERKRIQMSLLLFLSCVLEIILC